MNITIKLAGTRFSIRLPNKGLKDMEIYCLDKHSDISNFLSESAMLLLRRETAKKLDIDDLGRDYD